MTEERENEPSVEQDGFEWAIVEILGHRKHAGRVREEERFGAKMLRIDVPVNGDATANGWQTCYYAASALFSFRLCDEATVIAANKPYDPASRLTHRGYNEDDL